MLPKIPYSMEKNKSLTIPIGNFNISSNYSPGDIAESYGISARKFPRLTTRRGREKVYEGGEILAMTVFNGELVTVRSVDFSVTAWVYIGDEKIEPELQGRMQRKLAVINNKLVIYPDKIYIEKADEAWMARNLEATLSLNNVNFNSNSISMGEKAIASGEGGSFNGDNKCFSATTWRSDDLESLTPGDLVLVDASTANDAPLTIKSISIEDKIIYFNKDEDIYDEEISGSFTLYKMRNLPGEISHFKAGDVVTVSGADNEENNISFTISKIRRGAIYSAADIFTYEQGQGNVTIERKVPDLDFICERDNRLYGVNNAEKTIYVSALGDPTNMYAYEGVSTDSFAVPVGGEGEFTGCCKYGESVIFFKEDKIYKMTGYTPADFAIDSYDVDGLEAGADRSIAIINEILYYKGKNGIFAYRGGVPTLISKNFGDSADLFFDAVAGTDGVNYYIAFRNDDDFTYLFCYNTRLGLWVLEEKTVDIICGFARKSNILYMAIEGGNVYQMNVSDDASDLEWLVQFVPFYETIEGKKIYSRLLMRTELPRGSYIIIEVRSDDGAWCEAGKIVGANKGIIPIRLPIARCDKFELRLRGKGEFTIYDILREYHLGSEV